MSKGLHRSLPLLVQAHTSINVPVVWKKMQLLQVAGSTLTHTITEYCLDTRSIRCDSWWRRCPHFVEHLVAPESSVLLCSQVMFEDEIHQATSLMFVHMTIVEHIVVTGTSPGVGETRR